VTRNRQEENQDSHISESVETLHHIDLEWNNEGSISDLYRTIETWIQTLTMK